MNISRIALCLLFAVQALNAFGDSKQRNTSPLMIGGIFCLTGEIAPGCNAVAPQLETNIYEFL